MKTLWGWVKKFGKWIIIIGAPIMAIIAIFGKPKDRTSSETGNAMARETEKEIEDIRVHREELEKKDQEVTSGLNELVHKETGRRKEDEKPKEGRTVADSANDLRNNF